MAYIALRVQLREQRRLRNRGLGLLISGWSVFMLAWLQGGLFSVLDGTGIAFLPVLGGFIEAGLDNCCSDPAAFILASVAQVAGVTLLAFGYARRRRALAQQVALVPVPGGVTGRF